eukprot:g5734.t1
MFSRMTLCDQFLAELNTPITWAEDVSILPDLMPVHVNLPTFKLPSAAEVEGKHAPIATFLLPTVDQLRGGHKRKRVEGSRMRKRKMFEAPRDYCTCTRTKCLKLYCICYRDGKPCGERCECKDCKNTVPSYKAKLADRCTCTNSGCAKGYSDEKFDFVRTL